MKLLIFALFTIFQIIILAGYYEIYDVGFYTEEHCTIISKRLNVSVILGSDTNSDRILINGTFRIHDKKFDEQNAIISTSRIRDLLYGHGDSIKEGNVTIVITTYLDNERFFISRNTFKGQKYQYCYVTNSGYRFERPRKIRLSTITTTCTFSIIDIIVVMYLLFYLCCNSNKFDGVR